MSEKLNNFLDEIKKINKKIHELTVILRRKEKTIRQLEKKLVIIDIEFYKKSKEKLQQEIKNEIDYLNKRVRIEDAK